MWPLISWNKLAAKAAKEVQKQKAASKAWHSEQRAVQKAENAKAATEKVNAQRNSKIQSNLEAQRRAEEAKKIAEQERIERQTNLVRGADKVWVDPTTNRTHFGNNPQESGQYVKVVVPNTKSVFDTQKAIEARANEVKQSQILLARALQKRWQEQGINTPAWMRQGLMRAIETDPTAISTKPSVGVTYRSGYRDGKPIMYNGRPINEIFNDITPGLPPHTNWRIADNSLRSAANYYDLIPQVITKHGLNTPITAINMLSDGLGALSKLYRGEPLKAKKIDIGPAPEERKNVSIFTNMEE